MDNGELVEQDQTDEALEQEDQEQDPVKSRRLVTQPYDLVIQTLVDQIRDGTIRLRPLSNEPKFQRRYVWNDRLASRLIESILLNVPVPPIYLSQDSDFKLDVIDGQQRSYSVFRFFRNEFQLRGLEVLREFNGKRFLELPSKEQGRFTTQFIRGVVITNDSDEEVKFDVFERLNSNTVPLNPQELRNCIYRGALIDLLDDCVNYDPWLRILGREEPDARMRDEELALRFLCFFSKGLGSYRTPQKHWLNDFAREGRVFDEGRISELRAAWHSTIDNCLLVFAPEECFRRPAQNERRRVINRAVMDLVMSTFAGRSQDEVARVRDTFLDRYNGMFQNVAFEDLISKSVDHKSRTLERFQMWNERVGQGLF